jgi:hypothetical protein
MAIMRSTKVSPGFDRHTHHDPVRQHARAAGDGREVAAGFADHWRRLAGDGRLVHRGNAFDDLAVGRDDFTGMNQDEVTLAQIGGRNGVPLGGGVRTLELLRPGLLLETAQAGRLRLAAAFGQRLGEVGEQYREP